MVCATALNYILDNIALPTLSFSKSFIMSMLPYTKPEMVFSELFWPAFTSTLWNALRMNSRQNFTDAVVD